MSYGWVATGFIPGLAAGFIAGVLVTWHDLRRRGG